MTDHSLWDEITEIESTLLSEVSTSPPDPLSTRERTLTRAYLLVAHAILEERIEAIFVEHFSRACEVIAANKFVPVGLLSFYAAALEWRRDMPSYGKRQWLGYMSSPVAVEYVASEVRENHGLKAANVQDLAKLVGVEWAVIDDAADVRLAALTTLGAKRGAAGHTSPFTSPVQAVSEEEYPANVREWVAEAVQTVIALEAVVKQLSATESAHTPLQGVVAVAAAGVSGLRPDPSTAATNLMLPGSTVAFGENAASVVAQDVAAATESETPA